MLARRRMSWKMRLRECAMWLSDELRRFAGGAPASPASPGLLIIGFGVMVVVEPADYGGPHVRLAVFREDGDVPIMVVVEPVDDVVVPRGGPHVQLGLRCAHRGPMKIEGVEEVLGSESQQCVRETAGKARRRRRKESSLKTRASGDTATRSRRKRGGGECDREPKLVEGASGVAREASVVALGTRRRAAVLSALHTV